MMDIDNKNNFWFLKHDLKVIAGALLVFCHELWRNNTYIKQYNFSLNEAEAMRDLFINLRNQCKTTNIMLQGKSIKNAIIYFALKECINNYEWYEVDTITCISKKELNQVLGNFISLFPNLERNKLKGKK